MPEVEVQVGQGLQIANVIKSAGLTSSTSEAIRMIEQGGVKIDGEKVTQKDLMMQSGKTIVVQIGKRRFAKVILA
jgi:tyrosyl-tRNA synthetase